MLRLTILLSSVLAIVMISACSQVPEPSSHLYSVQKNMQAVHHWELMAKDVAGQITKDLMARGASAGKDGIVENKALGPFFVKNQGDTIFGEGFYELLVSQMVNSGLVVSVKNSSSSLIVNYNVVGVHHEASRPSQFDSNIVGKVIRNSIILVRNVLTLGAFPERPVPHSEVIVTVSIDDTKEYMMRSTFMYYINDPDFWHYEQMAPAKQKIKLSSQ